KKHVDELRKKMEKAAGDLNFELAAEYRDRMIEAKEMLIRM
ncbi:MAG: UvrB/UvrC motif-containing protein, partial [Lachnospiraceae bacterium]|nr:UvrB/UvrC motif-containing protein [Lachnospiraceae bacterium]